MRKVGVVAWYTFLEGMRARFFVGTLFVSLAVVLIGAIVGSIPYGRPDQVVATIGWGAVFLSGCLISVFYVTTSLNFEREARVLQMLLSKPVRRGAYAAGKLVGFSCLTVVMLLIELGVLYAATWFIAEEPRYRPELLLWLWGAIGVACKCISLVAVAAWFAWMFQSQMVAMLASMTVFLAGVGTQDLLAWAKYAERPGIETFAKILGWATPQFAAYDLQGWATYAVAADAALYLQVYAYYIGYAVVAGVLLWLTAEWQELR